MYDAMYANSKHHMRNEYLRKQNEITAQTVVISIRFSDFWPLRLAVYGARSGYKTWLLSLIYCRLSSFSKYTEAKTDQNCRFLSHYISTDILKLEYGNLFKKYSIPEV